MQKLSFLKKFITHTNEDSNLKSKNCNRKNNIKTLNALYVIHIDIEVGNLSAARGQDIENMLIKNPRENAIINSNAGEIQKMLR